MKLALLLMVGVFAFAEEPKNELPTCAGGAPPPSEPCKPVTITETMAKAASPSRPIPEITAEQQRDYHKARAALIATPQQRALDDIVAAMQATCGDRQLIADAKGDPTCGKAQPAAKEK